MLRVRTGGYGLCFECGQVDIILANENHRPSRFAARSRLIVHGTASNRVWRPTPTSRQRRNRRTCRSFVFRVLFETGAFEQPLAQNRESKSSGVPMKSSRVQ